MNLNTIRSIVRPFCTMFFSVSLVGLMASGMKDEAQIILGLLGRILGFWFGQRGQDKQIE